MNESIGEIHRLLQEAIALLKSGTKPDARKARRHVSGKRDGVRDTRQNAGVTGWLSGIEPISRPAERLNR